MAEEKESVKQNNAEEVEQTDHTVNATETDDEASQADQSSEQNQQEEANNESEKIDSQEEKINELEQLANDNEEKYLRLYAEFENYKRRIQKENETNHAYKAQSVLTDILPTIDNIERALQIEGNDESFKSLQKGVQMVHESLLRALKDNGLEVIETEGQTFDPNVHQAVVQDDNPDYESGEITQELQKGYKLKDRVLRPSMVKVNQ